MAPFCSFSILPKTPDGTTTISLYYNRVIRNVAFDTGEGGSYVEPVSGLYGAHVPSVAEPTRPGFEFKGWENMPATFPLEEQTIVKAKWTAVKVPYTVMIMFQDPDDTSKYNFQMTYAPTDRKGNPAQLADAGTTLTSFAKKEDFEKSNKSLLTYYNTNAVTVVPVTIKGDGSSILIVKYDLKTYTLKFDLDSYTAQITIGGQTYSGSDYSFTARYMQDISSLWPMNVSANSWGWAFTAWVDKDNTSHVSKRKNLTSDLLASTKNNSTTTFTAQYGGSNTYYLSYEFQNELGTDYVRSTDYSQFVTTSSVSSWGCKDIDGFTAVEDSVKLSDDKILNPDTKKNVKIFHLKYDRNSYTITFKSGDTSTTTKPIKYDADISGYGTQYQPANPPIGKEGYAFAGWYTSEDCLEGTQYDFTKAKMPAGNLVLYANWLPPIRNVIFKVSYDNGNTFTDWTTQQVRLGDSIPAFEQPTMEGYELDYWYELVGGKERIFLLSTAVTRDIVLYGKWTPKNTEYTVKYTKIDRNGNTSAAKDDKIVTRNVFVGSTVTEFAPDIPADSNGEFYPDQTSKSLVLIKQNETNKNTIEFIYHQATKVYYVINYVDQDDKPLCEPVYGETADKRITATAKYFSGYTPNYNTRSLRLVYTADQSESAKNTITFKYTENTAKASYTVNYYLQNPNTSAFELKTDATKVYENQAVGKRVYAEQLVFDGYQIVTGISTLYGTVRAPSQNDTGLTLNLYYKCLTYNYTVSYRLINSTTELANPTSGTALYGKQKTLYPKSITNYNLVMASTTTSGAAGDLSLGDSSATLTIRQSSRNNVTFYYERRTDITATVKFVLADDEATQIASPKTISTITQDGVSRPLGIGDQLSYTLADGEMVLVSDGVRYLHVASEATTGSVTIKDGTNEIVFHYAAENLKVSYDGNAQGVSGVPTDDNAYQSGATVNVVLTPAPTRGDGYVFAGWTTSNAYANVTTQDALQAISPKYIGNNNSFIINGDTTLYAIWARATVTYVCNEAVDSGTVPAAQYVLPGSQISVAGNSGALVRNGYVFDGWLPSVGAQTVLNGDHGAVSLTITQDTTLVAQWSTDRYDVIYTSNLPEAAKARLQNPNAGYTTYNVTSDTYTLLDASCDGYVFDGWQENGATITAIEKGTTGDRTLVAMFHADTTGFAVADYSDVYDAAAHSITLTGPVATDTIEYTVDGSTTSTNPAWTNVTSKTVAVTVNRDGVKIWPNNGEDNTATVTITPAPLTIAVQSEAIVFDGQPHSLSNVSPSGLKGSDALTAYELTGNSQTDVGVYSIPFDSTKTVITPSNDNYTIGYTNGTLTIVDFTVTGYSGEYDGKEHDGVSIADIGQSTLLDQYNVTYQIGDELATDEMPKYKDVITQNVRVIFTPKAADAGLPTFSKSALVTITPIAITLGIDSIDRVYDGANHSLTVTLPDTVLPLDRATILANVVYKQGQNTISNRFLNVCDLTVSVESSCDNYVITGASTTVKITRRVVTVTTVVNQTPSTKVYDGTPFTFSYIYDRSQIVGGVMNDTGVLPAHTLTAVLDFTQWTDVCTNKAVTVARDKTMIETGSHASMLSNYDVRYSEAVFSITTETGLTLDLIGVNSVYDSAAKIITVNKVLAGQTPVDMANFTWTYSTDNVNFGSTMPSRRDAGTTIVYVKGTSKSSNYGDVTGSANITIAPRDVTITPDSIGVPTPVEYTGNDYTVNGFTAQTTATDNDGKPLGTTGLVGQDRVTSVTLIGNVQNDVGTHPVTWQDGTVQMSTGLLSNYNFVHGEGKIVIAPATSGLTITMNNDAVTYDAAGHHLNYSVSAPSVNCPYVVEYSIDNGANWIMLANGATLPDYTEYRAAPYAIKARVSSTKFAEGYYDYADASLTINKRDLTITSETDESFIYDHTQHEVDGLSIVAGLVDNTVGSLTHAHRITAFDYETDKLNTRTEAGTNPVKVDVSTVTVLDESNVVVSGNYNIVSVAGKITVSAQTASAADTAATVTYDGQPHGFTLPTLLDQNNNPVTTGNTYQYRIGEGEWLNDMPTYVRVNRTNVNDTAQPYEITVKIINPNYVLASGESVTATARLTINPAIIEADVKDATHYYTLQADGTPKTWIIDTADVTGTLYEGAVFEYDLTDADGKPNQAYSDVGDYAVRVGSYRILIKGAQDVNMVNNYSVRVSDGILHILPSNQTGELATGNLGQIYDAHSHSLPAITISVPNEQGQLSDQTAQYEQISYLVKNANDPLDAGQTMNTLPTFTNVGSWTIAITATDTDGFLPTATGSATAEILARNLMLYSGTRIFSYDAQPHSVDGISSYNGLVDEKVGNGTIVHIISDLVFAQDKSNTRTDVGDNDVLLESAKIYQGATDVTGNYIIDYVAGHITVNALNVSGGIDAQGYDDVFDAQGHSVTVSDTLVTSIGNFSIANTQTANGQKRFTVSYEVAGKSYDTAPAYVNATATPISVKISVTDATGNIVFTPVTKTIAISKRPVTITPHSNDGFVYDGNMHAVVNFSAQHAPSTGEKVGLLGTDDVTSVKLLNNRHSDPGQYDISWEDFSVVFTSETAANNYLPVHALGSMTISQATGLTMSVTGYNGVYDDAPHTFSNLSSNAPTGCPVTYQYLAGPNDWRTVDLDALGKTNAGTYPTTFRAISANYKTPSAEVSASIVIGKKPITITANDATAIFDGSFHGGNGVTPASGDLIAGHKIAQSSVRGGGINVGTHPLTPHSAVITDNLSLNDLTSNYDIAYRDGTLTINKQTATTADVSDTKTYSYTDYAYPKPQMMYNGSPLAGVTYEYSASGAEGSWRPWMPTERYVNRLQGNAVGSYQLKVRMSHPNFETLIATSTLTIQPRALTVSIGSDTFPYTLDAQSTPHEWSINTVTYDQSLVYAGTEADYELVGDKRSALGDNPITFDHFTILRSSDSEDLTSNYALSLNNGHITVTVGNVPSTIVATGLTTLYDGAAHQIAQPTVYVQSQDRTHNVEATSDFTLSYKIWMDAQDETQAVTYNSLPTNLKDAHTYHIRISATSSLHSAPSDALVDLTINKRNVTVKADDNSRDAGRTPFVFSGAAQTLSDVAIGGDGLPAGYRLGALSYASGMSDSNADVCDRAIEITGVTEVFGPNGADNLDNYLFSFTNGRIVIEPLPIVIQPTGLTTVYDGNPYSITVPVSVSTTAGSINVADQFELSYSDGSAFQPDNFEYREAGVYPVTVRFTAKQGCNFVAADATAEVIIEARDLIVSYGSINAMYDGQIHEATRDITGLVSRDAINLIEQNRSATNATYVPNDAPGALAVTAIDWTVTDANDASIDRLGNYNVQIINGTMNVRPREIAVTAGTQSFVYNAAVQGVTDASLTSGSLVQGHQINYTLTGNTALDVVNNQPVGFQSLTVEDQSGASMTRNYAITTNLGQLTITPAPLTLAATTEAHNFSGAAFQPTGYILSGVQGTDTLGQYAFLNMPQVAVGHYGNVSFDPSQTVLVDQSGRDVTGNYRITYQTGDLTILTIDADYSVEYYYNGTLDATATATLTGTVGEQITLYPTRLLGGYRFDHVEGLPLTLTRNGENVIRVFYVTAPEVELIVDVDIPLAGNMASLNVGVAIE